MSKRWILTFLVFSVVLRAQEEELSLDPSDIPLSSDPALAAPTENIAPIAPAEVPPANATETVLETLPQNSVVAPEAVSPTTTPALAAPTQPTTDPTPVKPIELKPTPSNLEVKADSNSSDTIKKEENFNKAYTKYHKDSTSDQNWEKVVGKRTADTYVVNKGDTLWDISGTLFGDPFYWPKIWSLNKDLIYNPHVIFPEMKIKFFQGNSKTAPTLATDNQVTDSAPTVATNEDKKEITRPDKESSEAENAPVEGRPKDVSFGSSLRRLPKFFKDRELKSVKEVEVQIEEYKNKSMEAVIKLEFYVAESPLEGAGRIVEVESELKAAGEDQYVFVKFNTDPHGVYTVVKPGKNIKESSESPMSADIHEVEGELKILGRVNSEENVYRAQVIRSNTLVSEGSIVVPGYMKTFKLTDSRSETTASKGRIIGNLNDYGVVGQGAFVLLNQGSQSGYQANMKLPIYEDLAKRNIKSFVKENPQKVGSLVIVETTENFSIAYVDRIFTSVYVNDFVGMAEGGEFDPKSAKASEFIEAPGVEEISPETGPENTEEL